MMTDNYQSLDPLMPISLSSARNHPFDPPTKTIELSKLGPLHRLIYPDGHLGWLVTGHATVRQVLTDPRFSARSEFKRAPVSRPGIDPFYGQPALPGWLVDMDPPAHTKYRRALSEHLSMRRIKALKPRIQEIVCYYLQEMEQLKSPVDLVEHFALPIPSLAICELLGVPYEQRKAFQHHSAVLFSLEVSSEQASTSMNYLNDFLLDLVRHKRQYPTHDLLSHLALLPEFNEEELAGLGVLLLTAGHETTTNMLALGTFALLSHPAQLAQLSSNPELIENAVEELLRYLTIFHFGVPRTPLEDVILEDQLIKAGESMTLFLPMANRDPQKFENPHQLDITRCAHGHFAFGYGVHYCLGMHLARLEMQIGYLELFKKFPTLQLAVPSHTIELNTNAGLYGVHKLPVKW